MVNEKNQTYHFFKFPNLKAWDINAEGKFYSGNSILLFGQPEIKESDKTWKYPWGEERKSNNK